MVKSLLNKTLRILLITNGIVLFAGAMVGPIYALFIKEELGGRLLDASLASGIFAITAGFVTLIAGRWADKVKENELDYNVWLLDYGIILSTLFNCGIDIFHLFHSVFNRLF